MTPNIVTFFGAPRKAEPQSETQSLDQGPTRSLVLVLPETAFEKQLLPNLKGKAKVFPKVHQIEN